MRVVCVIPARIGSTRLPNKPLQTIGGEPLIRLVVQRAGEIPGLHRVVVATDDERVAAAVVGLDVETLLTVGDFKSGTERVAEAVSSGSLRRFDVIVNLQGDEPFVPTRAVVGALERVSAGDGIGTAGAPVTTAQLSSPNRVKVLVDREGIARGFARRIEPASHPGDAGLEVLEHLGIYAYRRDALERWVSAAPVPEEIEHSLEQLRPLAYGERIGVVALSEHAPPAIDTPADLAEAEQFIGNFMSWTTE